MTVPVRSAPLRRRRKDTNRSAADDEVTAGTVTDDKVTVGQVTEDTGADEKVTDAGAAETAAADLADIEQTPDERTPVVLTESDGAESDGDADTVEANLSYRQRRQRRQASAARPAPGGVTRSSALKRRSDRPIGWLVAGLLSVVVIIALLVTAAVFAIGVNRLDHRNDLRAEYSQFAQQMTVSMTSLNPKNVDAALKTMQDKTSGTAQQRLSQSMSQVVSLVREQNLEVASSVLSDAVTKATDSDGSVIVVYGWQMKPENPKEETIVQTFRWRIDITRINGELKMTNFEWVT
ncbi:hypothetical protein [Gordonia sp. NPDC003376]